MSSKSPRLQQPTHTHLLGEFTVFIDVSYLLAAEVSGGLCAGTAVDRSFGVATVVVAIACGGLALIHGIVLGCPLQRWETFCSSAKQHTEKSVPVQRQGDERKHRLRSQKRKLGCRE